MRFGKDKMLSLGVVIVGLLSQTVLANVEPGKVKDSYKATDSMELEWKDDGDDPKLDDISKLDILLCTGSNSDFDCFTDAPLAQGVKASLKKYKAPLTPVKAVGGNGPYFLQYSATDKDGQQSLLYSKRFKLSGMTGSKKASNGGDTDPPDDQKAEQTADQTGTAIAYTKQKGPTKTAPMQSQPGTKVNLKRKTSRLWPTSAVSSYYKTAKKSPNAKTTLTPGWSYTFSAFTNYAKTRPKPTKYYAASDYIKTARKTKSKNKDSVETGGGGKNQRRWYQPLR